MPRRHPKLTCGEALTYYLAEHVRREVVDSGRQEDCVRNLRLFFEHLYVDAIGIPDCREYAAKRMSGELCIKTKRGKIRRASAGTVKRELNTLHAAFAHNAKWKRIGKAEIPYIERPKTKRTRGLWLFPDELIKLREAANEETRDYIDLLYYTGARRRSIENLTWDRVDLERGRINLARPDDPVTKKHKPIVPVCTALRPTFERLLERKADDKVTHGTVSGFNSALRKAGLWRLAAREMRPPGLMSPHVLRHSRATHLLQEGKPPKAVADLLGDNVMTVLRVYGHACPGYLEDVME